MRTVAFLLAHCACVASLSCVARETSWRPSLEQPGEAGDSNLWLVIGRQHRAALEQWAGRRGRRISGEEVLEVEAEAVALRSLRSRMPPGALILRDEPLFLEVEEASFEVRPETTFVTKEELGLTRFAEQFPEADGRGVLVGIIDNGVSPLHSGLRETSTGERKYLRHASNSSSLTIPVQAVDPSAEPAVWWTYRRPYDQRWQGVFDEDRDGRNDSGVQVIDVNNNHRPERYQVAVFQKGELVTLCVDLNVDGALEEDDECFGSFAETGDYAFWNRDKLLTVTGEFDAEGQVVLLSEGEKWGDSHAESVASVMVGHQIGGSFDGVAPGAQFLDYDYRVPSVHRAENQYTLATFLRALEWMGQQGAEVVNISSSFYFLSPASQLFMREALSSLVDRYNFVLCFSAGNDGPSLGSLNKSLVYPTNSLVVGAFVDPRLDESVHGVTGIPEPGRVMRYSSRGPGPDQGGGPSVVAPLAAVTHSSPIEGYRGFGGTSSSSPAVAGFAAVLISAIKQRGLSVDASAVVHAIRLSGVPVPGVPSVEQGTGLPQIQKALELYAQMIAGGQFVRLETRVRAGEGDGPVTPTGLLIRVSDRRDVREVALETHGVFASSLPLLDVHDRGREVALEYSQPWLSGPARAFVSRGLSEQYLMIDTAALVSLSGPRGLEHFAEVRFLDQTSGQLLHVVPVTYVDDVNLAFEPLVVPEQELGAEEGRRFHFFVPPGVPGVALSFQLTAGNREAVETAIVDSRGNVVFGTLPGDSPSFVDLPRPGWHQLTVVRKKGTPVPFRFRAEVSALQVSLASAVVDRTRPAVQLWNWGGARAVRVELRPRARDLGSSFVVAAYDEPAVFDIPVSEEGQYSLTVRSAEDFASSNWLYACVASQYLESGELYRHRTVNQHGLSFKVKADQVAGHVVMTCLPFEYPGEDYDATGTVIWQVDVSVRSELTGTVAEGSGSLVASGLSSVNLGWVEEMDPAPGQELDVVLAAVPAGSSVPLGSVTLLPSSAAVAH